MIADVETAGELINCLFTYRPLFILLMLHCRAEPWVEFCGNRDLLSVPLSKLKNMAVCSKHFYEDDLGTTGRRKRNVVPRRFAPENLSVEEMRRWRSFVEPHQENNSELMLSSCSASITSVSANVDDHSQDVASRPHNSRNEANSGLSL